MRIVRPGSVVGPQQQYMYLKQLEWVKWSAIDEVKRQQAAATKASTTLVTPATPPADSDDEMDARPSTPPLNTVSLPPVTPNRHIATAAAKAKAIAPPGQPRKTPKAKRAVEDTEEDEENDALPALKGPPTTRNRSKTVSKPTAARGVTASEQRPTRVTRSTAGAANIRRAGAGTATTAVATPESPVKVATAKQGPNKIPRLATTRTTAAARAAATATSRQVTSRNPPSPIPSRLPTLIPSKRPHHTSSMSEVTGINPLKPGVNTAADGWVNNTAVVNTTSKSERPNLRSVRRRRSSFSNADVVA